MKSSHGTGVTRWRGGCRHFLRAETVASSKAQFLMLSQKMYYEKSHPNNINDLAVHLFRTRQFHHI
ncbi:hypothetical protein LCGC14_1179980 [marine sediment metagenome]|uniref:Uncharacterized protein n=1 Tax=marine sediment metagenome TaxID=412755 RepID=A0A0F9MA39_9ZZZZ